MKWHPKAEAAVKKVPFFVRKRVRLRVEEEARRAGKELITLAEVEATQKNYLKHMEKEVKGYQLETCFGSSGCPHRIHPSDELFRRIEQNLVQADLPTFLKSRVRGALKFHHEFRIALADCPNACCQPQIKDIGIIAACFPRITAEVCSGCAACEETCTEAAVRLDSHIPAPLLDTGRCLACGQCIPACPTGILAAGVKGYRIQLGGKLGRHPQLAREMPGIYDADTTNRIVAACIDFYKANSKKGERFGEILKPSDFDALVSRFSAVAHPWTGQTDSRSALRISGRLP